MGEFDDKPRGSARPAVLVKGNKIEMALDSDSIEYATTVNAVIQKTGGVVSDFFDRKDGTWTTTILVSGELLKAHFDISGTTLEWIGKETREFLNLAGWLSAEVETIRASKFGIQLFPWSFRTSLNNHDVYSLLDKCISQFHCEWESEHNEFRIRLLTRRFSGSELAPSDPRLQLSRSLDSDVFRGQFVYSEVSLENINYHLSLRCQISKLLGMPVDCRFMQYGVDDYPGDYIPYEDLGIRE